MIDNKFIHSGYRVNYNSFKLTVKSLFHFHNELINIWSHLIGAVIALLAIVYIAVYLNENFGLKDKLEKDLHLIFDPVLDEINTLGLDPFR